MNYFAELWNKLVPLYDETEAKAIIRTVLEMGFNLSFTDIICGKVNELTAENRCSLQKITDQLLQGKPVQYVLGIADFAGRTFQVTPSVLIPRTETEELCKWIISDSATFYHDHPTILDIGTGSGVIAITLDLDIAKAKVTAWDISIEALTIAQQNAKSLQSQVYFTQQDLFSPPHHCEKWDIIVSNPPYIHPKEAENMERNVLDFEPKQALFVPENQPLCFYEAIVRYAQHALKLNGLLYFEINPLYVCEMKTLLKQASFSHITIQNDAFNKPRMMRATWKPARINP